MMRDIHVRKLKESNERTFRTIMEIYGGRLTKFASIYTLNDQISKEIVQDCFLTLWFKRKELRDDTCLITYLMVICRNRCLNYLAKRKEEIIHWDDLEEEYIFLLSNEYVLTNDSLDLLMAQDLSKAIDEAINKLPQRAREIFMLSRQEGLKNHEIAEKLQIAPKTVEFHLTKALGFLKEELKVENFLIILWFYNSLPK